MKNRPLLAVFAATLFTSAFLIFSVQPMASKMLLPLLGGSPSVWNTAMVFFQAMLLAGYAYAHVIARYLSLTGQALLHLCLLAGFLFVLPLALPPGAAAPSQDGQALWQLGIMLASLGGPFFVLAASAPLFQHWFAASGHEDAANPYHLYAISNAGSMVALLSYPVLAEPLLTLQQQTQGWMGGYILLLAFTASCAWLVRGGNKPVPPLADAGDTGQITLLTRAGWIMLSFIPSSLMLGVTTIITTDLASAPFLWIIPLTLYLVTFIIAFSRKPLLDVALTRELSTYVIALSILMFMLSAFVVLKIPMVLSHLFTFFFCSLLCHGELARIRPSASHLTEYFLLISLGGVLGGLFNAIIAPALFLTPIEYALTLGMIGFVIWAGHSSVPAIKGKFNQLEDRLRPGKIMLVDVITVAVGVGLCAATYFAHTNFLQTLGTVAIFLFLLITAQNRPAFAFTALCALLLFHTTQWSRKHELLALGRNYFGVLKVYQNGDMNFFYHGTTLHGAQAQQPQWKSVPLTYYHPGGPASDTLELLKSHGQNQRIAALGLGVGSIACYTAPRRRYDFYELDVDVVKVAENPDYFSYLSDCGSPYRIVLGDARLKIKEAADNSYDMIFIDTFSSDSIPVHIITREAFEIYLKKLAHNGIIAINISNRFLNLQPALAAVAKEFGLTMYTKYLMPEKKDGDISALYAPSSYVAMARDPKTIAPLMEEHGWAPYAGEKDTRIWTDDYANILSALHVFNR